MSDTNINFISPVPWRIPDAKANSAESKNRYYSSENQYVDDIKLDCQDTYTKKYIEQHAATDPECAYLASDDFKNAVTNSPFFRAAQDAYQSQQNIDHDESGQRILEQFQSLTLHNSEIADLVLQLPESLCREAMKKENSSYKFLSKADADSIEDSTAQTIHPNQNNLNKANMIGLTELYKKNPEAFDTWVKTVGEYGAEALLLGSENYTSYIPNNSSIGVDYTSEAAKDSFYGKDGQKLDSTGDTVKNADTDGNGLIDESELYNAQLFVRHQYSADFQDKNSREGLTQNLDMFLRTNNRKPNADFVLHALQGKSPLEQTVLEIDKSFGVGYKKRGDFYTSLNALATNPATDAANQYKTLQQIRIAPANVESIDVNSPADLNNSQKNRQQRANAIFNFVKKSTEIDPETNTPKYRLRTDIQFDKDIPYTELETLFEPQN